MKRYAKKRTGRRDMDVRSVFAEIFECADATGSFLKFVEDDQCLFFPHLYAGMGFKDEKDSLHVVVSEKIGGEGVLVAVDIDARCVFASAKLFEEPCLPDLPCTAKNQRLASRRRLPIKKRLVSGSFHLAFSRMSFWHIIPLFLTSFNGDNTFFWTSCLP